MRRHNHPAQHEARIIPLHDYGQKGIARHPELLDMHHTLEYLDGLLEAHFAKDNTAHRE